MSYVQKQYVDADRNGAFDFYEEKYVNLSYFGDIAEEKTVSDYGFDGTVDATKLSYTMYEVVDGLYERPTLSYSTQDLNGDGVFEFHDWFETQYDAAGNVSAKILSSLDYDSDNQPDVAVSTDNTYNASNQITLAETHYMFNGVPDNNYRTEEYVYDNKGRLSEHITNDTQNLDFEIAEKYSYNSRWQLTKIQERDEFDYGDNNYHTAATFFYDSKKPNLLKESNYYAENYSYTDANIQGDNVLEIKTKFTYYDNNLIKSELKIGAEYGTWNAIDKQLSTFTYDDLGRKISEYVQADPEGDGTWNPGMDTLHTMTYGDSGLMSEVWDYNFGDGVAESVLIVEPWSGLLS